MAAGVSTHCLFNLEQARTRQEHGPGPEVVDVGKEREAHEADQVAPVENLWSGGAFTCFKLLLGWRGRHGAQTLAGWQPRAGLHHSEACDAAVAHPSLPHSVTPVAHLEELAARPVDGGGPQDESKQIGDGASQEVDGGDFSPVCELVPKAAERKSGQSVAGFGHLRLMKRQAKFTCRGSPGISAQSMPPVCQTATEHATQAPCSLQFTMRGIAGLVLSYAASASSGKAHSL